MNLMTYRVWAKKGLLTATRVAGRNMRLRREIARMSKLFLRVARLIRRIL